MKKIFFVFMLLLASIYVFGQANGVDAPEMGEGEVVSTADADAEQTESAEIAQAKDDAESAKAAAKMAKQEAARKKAEEKAAAKEAKVRKKAAAKAAKEVKVLKEVQENAAQNANDDEGFVAADSENNENALESEANVSQSSESSADTSTESDSAASSNKKGVYYVAEKYYTSQDYYTSVDGTLTEEDILKIRESMQRKSLLELRELPLPMINWGLSYANVTRLQKQDSRSNFVWQNNLFGLFCEIQSKNMKPVNSLIRLSMYYPLTHTFNGMSQIQGMLLYAFDLFAGPFIEASMWDYVYLKFGLGIHYMYQLTDEFYFHYLGAGALVGFELPVAPRWTIILDGNFNYDYPNLGSNRIIQPYEYSWQYHIDFGVRYSKWGENPHSYVRKTALQTVLWDARIRKRDELRAEKDAMRAEKKIAYLKAHPEKVARRKKYKAKKLAMADAKAARDAEKLRIAEQKVAKMFEKKDEKTLRKKSRKTTSAAAREKANEAKRLEKESRERAKAEEKEANAVEGEKIVENND